MSSRSLGGWALPWVLSALCFTTSAGARVEAGCEYTKAQTYSAALRYLRLDLGYEVLERDPDAAYLIFRYEPPGQAKAGSQGTLEVIEAEGHVKLYFSLPRLPEYHERVLRDGLVRKLREEYGAPRQAPKKAKEPSKEPGPAAPKPSDGDDPERDTSKPDGGKS